MTTRTKGRLLALLILAVALGVTGVAVMNARRGGGAAPTRSSDDQESFTPPSTNRIVGTPGVEGTTGSNAGAVVRGGGGVQDLVSLAEEGVFTRVNRETGELEYRMTWASLDPQEGGVFLLTQPRAWIYERGRVIEVGADSGRLRWPSREREPESGLLEGHVTIVGRSRSGTPGQSDGDGEELLRVLTSTLNFHSTLGELRTTDQVTITGSGATMNGRGLTVRFSQEKARPLTYFRMDEGGRFTYSPPPPPPPTPTFDPRIGRGAPRRLDRRFLFRIHQSSRRRRRVLPSPVPGRRADEHARADDRERAGARLRAPDRRPAPPRRRRAPGSRFAANAVR